MYDYYFCSAKFSNNYLISLPVHSLVLLVAQVFLTLNHLPLILYSIDLKINEFIAMRKLGKPPKYFSFPRH